MHDSVVNDYVVITTPGVLVVSPNRDMLGQLSYLRDGNWLLLGGTRTIPANSCLLVLADCTLPGDGYIIALYEDTPVRVYRPYLTLFKDTWNPLITTT